MDEKIKLYGPRLFGLCLTLCRNKDDAWDLYQDTWLKACERQEQYNRTMAYDKWLSAICVNKYRDKLRRQKIAPFLEMFATTEDKDAVMENVYIEEPEDFSEVSEAVNNLPDKYRQVVLLFYFEEKDIKGTAQIMGIPEGTVKSRLLKARKMLKEVLKDEWYI